ncbi:hypothetical protein J6524_05285 [Bradyrhizobium sp. WSM 1738]|uniref:hypothetical protein n=1 Tax=Bradyrhizobium hereditatis TaxID=2821405 RepID=UPI001CE2CAFC|nr:hypothetical protein [Bradyrhizobium hereditatis]MCA6114343.1 hypothetical protein [Bradyrhizobium hereditatis]
MTEKVSGILNREWHPIPGDCPEDEYNSYALKIAGMVLQGADDHAIMRYLERSERHDIGLGSFDHNRASQVIAAIRTLPSSNSNTTFPEPVGRRKSGGGRVLMAALGQKAPFGRSFGCFRFTPTSRRSKSQTGLRFRARSGNCIRLEQD